MTALLFTGVVVLAITLFYLGTGRNMNVLLVSLLWASIVGALAYLDFFSGAFALPKVMLLVNLPAIAGIVLAYRRLDINRVKLPYLLAVHTLRLPVEVVLYRLFLEKKVPRLMTFLGWNLDILVGISAMLLLLYMLFSRRKPGYTLLKIWNITGLVFLAIIVTLAILSAPSPIQQLAFVQPNIAITSYPYTLLPGLVVPLVLLSHLLSLKVQGRHISVK